MSTSPLVSCIIIFLNAEKYLEEAVQSVMAQTYPHWELLLVDDGSSDGSTTLAALYADQYPEQIRYLEHPEHQNRGMSASRNLGVQHASGEYIAFLDADDVWLPMKLEQQVAILRREPRAAMVYGRTLIWNSWRDPGETSKGDHTVALGVQPDALIEPPTLFLLMLQNMAQTPTTCNAILRRSVFTEIGTFEEQFRGMYEDQAFFAKVQLQAPIYVSGACWAKYRQHAESCSAVAERTTDYATNRLVLLNWLREYLADHNRGTGSTVWWALQKERWLCHHPRVQGIVNRFRYAVWHLRSRMNMRWGWKRVGTVAEER